MENDNVLKLPKWEEIPTLEEMKSIDIISQYELDPTIEDEPLKYTFSVNGINIAPKGDIQAIKGLQKNGKGFWEVLLMGAALKGEYLGVKCLLKDPKILFCDTEQQSRNTRLVYRRVCLIAGIDGHIRHERINMQNLRLAENVDNVREAIKLKIKTYKPDIVFIDGLVDCLIDFNDLKESKRVITEFSKLALEHNCSIWCTLHTNPSGENTKMRGHVGTILSQKTTDVICCIKEKQADGTIIFKVEQTENRNNANFDTFAFAVEMRKDERNEYIALPVKVYVSVKEKISLDDIFKWALSESPLRRSDLRDKLMSEDSPFGPMKRSTAYDNINNAIDAGIIKDDDPVTNRIRYVGLDLPNEEGLPY